MHRFRRFGMHTQARPAAFGVLLAAIVCAAGVAWSTTSAHPTSQSTLAANQSFAVALPAIVRLAEGQRFSDPAQSVVDEMVTTTPTLTETPTSTPTTTPTITASPLPINTAECDQAVKQNLVVHLAAPNTAEVTNRSTQCTYPVGLASYTMLDDNLSHQQLFSSQVAVLGPGQTQTLVAALPDCAYQLDLFYGALIEHFDPQHGLIYGDRILLTRVVRNGGFCTPGTTTPTSVSTPTLTPTGSPTPIGSVTLTPTVSPTSTPTATETVTPGGGN